MVMARIVRVAAPPQGGVGNGNRGRGGSLRQMGRHQRQIHRRQQPRGALQHHLADQQSTGDRACA